MARKAFFSAFVIDEERPPTQEELDERTLAELERGLGR